jgi:hypothetical protein
MRMPGFTAEALLDDTPVHYYSCAAPRPDSSCVDVLPQACGLLCYLKCRYGRQRLSDADCSYICCWNS